MAVTEIAIGIIRFT